jgi:hypothetical protein
VKKLLIGCLAVVGAAILAFIAVAVIVSVGASRHSTSSKEPAGESSAAAPAPALKLMSWHWGKSYDHAITEGQVKNVSSAPLEHVAAVVVFKTKDGTFITSDEALIDYDPLLPGQTSPFKVHTRFNPAMQTASLDFKRMYGGSISWTE